jgi:hypothetical protein
MVMERYTFLMPAAGENTEGWVTHAAEPSLAFIQEAVGGLIERVPLSPVWDEEGYTMWAHEEALMTPFPVLNQVVSTIARMPIYGDVLIVRDRDPSA